MSLSAQGKTKVICNSMLGQDRLRAGRQEVGKCSTRGVSRGMYITFASAKKAN